MTAFIALLKWVKSQGVQPVLLMTPYHQNVWLVEASPNVKAMIPTEKIVREIGLDLGVAVIGSYRPDVVNCRSGEFYDFMHATASCLAKMTATPAN
ncbi:hypothetical protein [Polaromonas sp. Pch-P]|uniref:hypothetical protein n=1 Tax=Polaromonas sp. Pch-P TaxID=2082385 RepID=UPI00129EA0B3|nr:hypothetical protein [Polaromonas sp. Pch-P]QGJ18850.1 hypothetical protein F7R28_10920 [Polaromonas sp. Pch-P]